MDRSAIHYWLALRLVPRLASNKKIILIKRFGLESLFSTKDKRSTLSSANGITTKQLAAFYQPDWQFIDSIINKSKRCHSEIITFDDPYYPQQLKQIYDPPLVLFIQGNKQLLNENQLAIVGSRTATMKGLELSFKFAQELAEHKLVVTSGLALGVDAAAHRGALTRKSGTIAVVATGLDQVYPTRHKRLATEITQRGGVVISEFLPGTPAKAGHFPKRNRLISGMCLGVLVVEAALKSGSLITARYAIEQNREVFSVPSSISNIQAKGCHWLIKQGAKLVEECADIIDELPIVNKSSLHLDQATEEIGESEKNIIDKKNHQNNLCKEVLLASVGFEVTPVDKVASRSHLSIEEVLTRLTMLELRGFISAVPGGYIRIK
ncbi:MAG: DNA-protecting protein DprA [Alteromonadales bacterium]|nr:DNA-protecting protein DprA [Alteromonadales bacterium]